MNVSRSGVRYERTKAATDAPAAQRMKELALQYPRYGYRRVRIFLERDGFTMGEGRAWRLWNDASLQIPRRRPRKRVAGGRPRPLPSAQANQVWSYDFVFDACANGQQIKCLTVVDEYTRECLTIDVAGSIRANRVIEVLSRLISERGAPRYLRSDNGPEFVSIALLQWTVSQGIETALIDPGKPWQNGTTESFNGKLRDECLSLEWFRHRTEARIVIEDWRPMQGFGSAGVLEIVEDAQGGTYRAVYALKIGDAIYVLHCFQKKSTHGISTPKPDMDLIRDRMKAAQEHAQGQGAKK
jgi:putative transposase